jgi:outer membrane protein assembly factor BamE
MKKLLLILIGISFLSACVHKIDIEQGNVITPGMLNHIHTGMSKSQVTTILGDPVLVNTFNDNQLDYVYTLKPGYGQLQERRITLIFQNNVLREIKSNM